MISLLRAPSPNGGAAGWAACTVRVRCSVFWCAVKIHSRRGSSNSTSHGGSERPKASQRVVCHHFKLRSTDLLSKDRHKSIAFARHVAMYLCKHRLKCSFPELGRAFGNRDHTTVISAVRKVEALRSSDPEVRAHLEALERKLGAVE